MQDPLGHCSGFWAGLFYRPREVDWLCSRALESGSQAVFLFNSRNPDTPGREFLEATGSPIGPSKHHRMSSYRLLIKHLEGYRQSSGANPHAPQSSFRSILKLRLGCGSSIGPLTRLSARQGLQSEHKITRAEGPRRPCFRPPRLGYFMAVILVMAHLGRELQGGLSGLTLSVGFRWGQKFKATRATVLLPHVVQEPCGFAWC